MFLRLSIRAEKSAEEQTSGIFSSESRDFPLISRVITWASAGILSSSLCPSLSLICSLIIKSLMVLYLQSISSKNYKKNESIALLSTPKSHNHIPGMSIMDRDTYQHITGRKVRADTLLLLSVLLRTQII